MAEGKVQRDDPSLPVIYVVTPTYARPVQKAELTRLCHAFRLVPNLHWILVEDARAKSRLVERHLRTCGVSSYTHLFEQTPPDWKLQEGGLVNCEVNSKPLVVRKFVITVLCTVYSL